MRTQAWGQGQPPSSALSLPADLESSPGPVDIAKEAGFDEGFMLSYPTRSRREAHLGFWWWHAGSEGTPGV